MKFTAFAAALAAVAAFSGAAFAAGHENQEITEFRIGLLGGENEADRLRNNECLRQHFAETLGLPVEAVTLFPAADYAGVLEGLLGGTLDYAELGASGYARIFLENQDAVEPILTTVQTDGSTGYYSVLVVRSDSDIETLEDLEGRTLGFADPNSTSGYLVPNVALPAQGIVIEDFFSATSFSGGHEQNVLAVLNGDIDGGVTWASGVGEFEDGYTNGNLRRMVDAGLVDMADLRQVWQSPLIPNGPIVVRSDLPQWVKDAVRGSLIRLSVENQDCMYAAMAGEINGFTPVSPEFYETIIEARRSLLGN